MITIQTANKFIKNLEIPFIIAGSSRRKKSQIKDIDIITNIKYKDYFTKTLQNLINKTIMSGNRHSIYEIIYKDNIFNLDVFFYYSSNELPYLLNYLTGNKFFNIAIRCLFKKKGFKLNQYSCINIKNNKHIYFNNEQDLFNFIGLHYIRPHEREVNSLNDAFKLFKKYKIKKEN